VGLESRETPAVRLVLGREVLAVLDHPDFLFHTNEHITDESIDTSANSQ